LQAHCCLKTDFLQSRSTDNNFNHPLMKHDPEMTVGMEHLTFQSQLFHLSRFNQEKQKWQ